MAILADFGVRSVSGACSAKLFCIDFAGQNLTAEKVLAVGQRLLVDPLVETVAVSTIGDSLSEPADGVAIEVHFKPGVMDNVAESTKLALADMGVDTRSVRTARRFELFPIPSDLDLARIPRLLGNPCIEDVFIGTRPIAPPPLPPTYEFRLRTIPLRGLDDLGLTQLSATGHLFLSLDEMRTIQQHFQAIGRDPTDLELETIAQTWSEHCVHKTLKSAIVYRGAPMPGRCAEPFKSRETQNTADAVYENRYENLLKDTIARATVELQHEGRGPQCLSVFKDNAGVIGFDDQYGVAFKVETHNHPSAIEPYGGASTGVGGVIRDVLGCGLGAKPIANTDVFCVAPPDWPIDAVPKGVIHPKTVLKGVVRGVRDYGNRMGIPTVNGAVHFDARYLGNPLVYCGCVGLIARDRIEKSARPGDAIVLLGGRTGRDGIHGATFSSAELTDAHADEFAHAVQIGNAIEEKKVLDVVLQACGNGEGRACLFSAITDCGAGGLSSAVGEMAAETGAEVDLENVPLKYAGLRYDEIWISEAQERMVLAVPRENVAALLAMAGSEDVEASVIGRFTDSGQLVIRHQSRVVGDLDLGFLHEGTPRIVREAEWMPMPASIAQSPEVRPRTTIRGQRDTDSPANHLEKLKKRLADPTVASKHWIIRQYDHEVGGRSVIKPLIGKHDGPADAAVIRPRLDSNRGIAIGCGLAPSLGDDDPYWMAVASIDEALRNVVCVGGDPRRTAILDNFCWPRVDDKRNLGALVRACQACYDVAKAYGLPFISGKDSLNNEFAMSEADASMVRRVLERSDASCGQGVSASGRLAIPYTLLISAISLIDDVDRCITSAPKSIGQAASLYYVGTASKDRTGVGLETSAELHHQVARLIASGNILAAHDCSEGGLLVAAAEMAFGADLGLTFFLTATGLLSDPFVEVPSGYIVQPRTSAALEGLAMIPGAMVERIAELHAATPEPVLAIAEASEPSSCLASVTIKSLRESWRKTLDW